MSLELVKAEEFEGVDLATLAALVNAEHAAMVQVATTTLMHAVRTGQLLNVAFPLVPWGEWKDWVETNCTFGVIEASTFRRIAFHAETLEGAGITSMRRAEQYVRDNGLRLPLPREYMLTTEGKAKSREARRMRSEGATYRQIEEALAVPNQTVWKWCNPEKAKAYEDRKKRERADLRRIRGEHAINMAGGATHQAYSLMRKAMQAMQTAIDREGNRDAKQGLELALSRLHAAEDEMYRAIRLTQENKAA